MFVASFLTFMAIGGFPSFVEDMKVNGFPFYPCVNTSNLGLGPAKPNLSPLIFTFNSPKIFASRHLEVLNYTYIV
jgi:hypothetical protein